MAIQHDDPAHDALSEKVPLMNGKSKSLLYSIQFRNGDTLNSFDKDAKLSHNQIDTDAHASSNTSHTSHAPHHHLSQTSPQSEANLTSNNNNKCDSQRSDSSNPSSSSSTATSDPSQGSHHSHHSNHSHSSQSNESSKKSRNTDSNSNSNSLRTQRTTMDSDSLLKYSALDEHANIHVPATSGSIQNIHNIHHNHNILSSSHSNSRTRSTSNQRHNQMNFQSNHNTYQTSDPSDSIQNNQMTLQMEQKLQNHQNISNIHKNHQNLNKIQNKSKKTPNGIKRKDDDSLLRSFLERKFKIRERGSSIGTEIRAGVVSFLTMAYIILINPKVLSISGLPYSYAAASTCLSSCVATLIAGIFGNLPVGCAPGVGLSAYFSYGMMASIRGDGSVASSTQEPWKNGMFVAFLSGALVFVLTLLRITPFIIHNLPEFIKVATIVGMGTFLAFIGLVDLNMIKPGSSDSGSILALGDMSDWVIWLAMLNALFIASLKYYKLKGSLLLGIVLTSLIYLAVTSSWPQAIFSTPRLPDPLTVLSAYDTPVKTMLSGGVSFVLILILDVSGCTFGIGKIAGLLNRNGVIEGGHWALVATSVGTMLAALTGCSPMIVAIESSAGAAAGGRTGLTAITIAFLFACATFFGPVLGDVPPAATSPVLVLIGVLMMGQVAQIRWDNIRIALPAYVTIVMMPFTYSISNGLFFGLGSFLVLYLVSGEAFYKLGWMKKSMDEKLGYGRERNIDEEDIDDMDDNMSIMSNNSALVTVQSYENLVEKYAKDFEIDADENGKKRIFDAVKARDARHARDMRNERNEGKYALP